MRTRVTKLVFGLIVTPLLLAALWAATQVNAVDHPPLAGCPLGSNWENCH
jgi:hypothetical protein